MTVIQRVRITWTGFVGGPGVSVFYFSETAIPNSGLRTFFNGVSTYLPNVVTINFPQAGDKIEDTTGVITGAWSAGPTTPVTGQVASAAYSGTSGACVDWLTGSVVAGRRPMGRTFLVPLAGSAYQNDGTILEAARTSLTSDAVNLVAAFTPNFLVWSRPLKDEDGAVIRAGTSSPVIGARIPDKAVVLRSRRQ
jgi:hypothetical protein